MTEPRPQSQRKGEYDTRVKSDPEEKNVANENEEELSHQNSTPEKNPDSRDSSNADVSGNSHDMPKSPVLSSSDSLMNITPCTSNGNGMDDFVIYQIRRSVAELVWIVTEQGSQSQSCNYGTRS